ncbi:hypothetical protein [Herbidospora mongoliensis]|uniref:hypothetical protein n=1 Tax=Herbidospora mongoliensis TaxID=688067 RepID=UPI000834EEA0|nr:hypothetical protein [Herbidospora mongoliensis]
MSPESAHTDPEIQAAWKEAREGLALMLRPYVQAAFVQDLASRYVEGLKLRGWRPPLPGQPLRPTPPPADPAATSQRGAQRAREELEAALGLDHDQEGR